jgi:predicted Zn-dependent peptidase
MRSYRLARWIVGIFVILSPCIAQEGFKGLKDRVVEHTLENGLTLLILERREVPVVSFVNVVGVGSVNEETGSTGLAHMFEHMAFKGTKRIGTTDYQREKVLLDKIEGIVQEIQREEGKGDLADRDLIGRLKERLKVAQQEAGRYVVKEEYSRLLERNGAQELNATTSRDTTTYLVSLPSNKVELWMALEADRLVNPVLREFYQERDVVIEERLGRENRPFSRLIEEALAVAYKAHPYGSPTIGHMSDLKQLTRRKAEEFYRKHYVPSNMVIGIVGDVDAKELIKLAKEYLGRLPSRPRPPGIVTREPPQQGQKIVEVESGAQPIYMMAFHKPSSRHPDEPVFICMSEVLGSGRTSRLYKSLVKQMRVATHVGAFSGFPGERYPNLFIIYGLPSAGHKVDEIEKVFEQELKRLKEELVDKGELDAAKSRVRARFLRRLDSNLFLARQLAETQVVYGDWRKLFDWLKQIDAVSPQDIKRVANLYLKRSNRIIAKLVPREE